MSSGPVRKFNMAYLLAYIFVPLIVCVLTTWAAFTFFPNGGTAAGVLVMVPWIVSIAWWIGGGRFLYKRAKKRAEAQLKAQGLNANQIFYSRGWSIFTDVAAGQVGLVSFWNPFKTFLIPASRIDKLWVDDGVGGVAIFKGSNRVSFLLQVDGANVRVDTFLANQRFAPNSDRILTGISKADTWVEILQAAKANSR